MPKLNLYFSTRKLKGCARSSGLRRTLLPTFGDYVVVALWRMWGGCLGGLVLIQMRSCALRPTTKMWLFMYGGKALYTCECPWSAKCVKLEAFSRRGGSGRGLFRETCPRACLPVSHTPPQPYLTHTSKLATARLYLCQLVANRRPTSSSTSSGCNSSSSSCLLAIITWVDAALTLFPPSSSSAHNTQQQSHATMAAMRTATVWQAGGLLVLLLLVGFSSALRYVESNWEV